MFNIYLEHASTKLKGELTRWLYQVKPSIFIGTTSAKIREELWLKITCEQTVSAVMIYSDNNEQGFSVKYHGEPKYDIVNIDGLNFINYKQTLSLDNLKAKSSVKALLSHCYETAITAKMIMTQGCMYDLTQHLSDILSLDIDILLDTVCFFAFVHDIGKIHPAFQHKIIPETMNEHGFLYKDTYKGFRHEIYSRNILDENGFEIDDLSEMLMNSIELHHQYKHSNVAALPENNKIWISMQNEVIEIAKQLYPLYDKHNICVDCLNGLNECLLGIINLADWMSSTQDVFDNKEYKDFATENDYIHHLENQVMTFLCNNLLDHKTLDEYFHNADYNNLIFQNYKLRPLQIATKDLADKHKDCNLIIIEADCGEGKTEAALYIALKMFGYKSGLQFLLPTSATSESMQIRVQELCNNIANTFKVPVYNSNVWIKSPDLSLDSNLWESDSKLKLLYPISVGTIDQTLKSVLSLKYSDIMLVALSNKVLILDEIHAYDAYMQTEIKLLLSFCHYMNVPVIMLSATLTKETKQEFINAYYKTEKLNNKVSSNSYPLLTYVENNNIIETSFESSSEKHYPIEIIHTSTKKLYETIKQAAEEKIKNGGNLVIIMNTVKHACELYKCMHADALLHSRLTFNDRQTVTQNIVTNYGKYDKQNHRPESSIVISTQIIEQSMDIDFDYMITELCPIDLLIQRLGRYHRHDNANTIRSHSNYTEQPITVICENKDYGVSKMIYNELILKLTDEYLSKHSLFITPVMTRESIEYCYNIDSTHELSKLNSTIMAKSNIQSEPSGIPWRISHKQDLVNHLSTRLNEIKTYDVLLLPKDLIEILPHTSFHQDRDLIINIITNHKYSSIPENIINRIISERQLQNVDKWNWYDDYIIFDSSVITPNDLI